METTERRGILDKNNIVIFESAAKRGVDIEESNNDTKSIFNDSEVNEIEHMFEGLSDYKDESLDFDHEKYTTGARENERRR